MDLQTYRIKNFQLTVKSFTLNDSQMDSVLWLTFT